MNKTLETMLKSAIPCIKVYFHAAVTKPDLVPENYFSDSSENPSRRVQMWYTPHTLICLQKGKYFGVPTSTISAVHFKCEITE